MRFKEGDPVERTSEAVPDLMRSGVITRVIPNAREMHSLPQYEVSFGDHLIAVFYEDQLRPAQDSETQ